jgi:hypothetical protein
MSFNYNIKARIRLVAEKKVVRANYTDEFNQSIQFDDWKTVIVLNEKRSNEEINLSAFIKLPNEQIFIGGKEYVVYLYIPALNESPFTLSKGQKFKIRENGIIGDGEILEIAKDKVYKL